MKNLIIVVIISLSCSTVKAQFNQSSNQVKETMSNEKAWRFVFRGEAKDGHLDGAYVLTYMEETQFLGKSFYFVNDSCKLIRFSYLNKRLKKIVKDMNDRFIFKGNNVWVDEKDHNKYELFLDKEKIGIFDICESPYLAIN